MCVCDLHVWIDEASLVCMATCDLQVVYLAPNICALRFISPSRIHTPVICWRFLCDIFVDFLWNIDPAFCRVCPIPCGSVDTMLNEVGERVWQRGWSG